MDTGAIKNHIVNHYRAFFDRKDTQDLPVPSGKKLAGFLGYPLASLDFIPDDYWSHFASCGNLLPLLKPLPGQQILNLGAGAGIDSLAVVKEFGFGLKIINMDVVFSILQRSRRLYFFMKQREMKFDYLCGDGENLPFQDRCFDWIMMNGVFNLFPRKMSPLHEVRRVLKASGSLVGADLCCAAALPAYFYTEPDAWAWCMSGALTEVELKSNLKNVGFEGIEIKGEEEGDLFHRIVFFCRKGHH